MTSESKSIDNRMAFENLSDKLQNVMKKLKGQKGFAASDGVGTDDDPIG